MGARSIYDAPELYQLLFEGWTADLSFYRGLAERAQGPILECGVGAGRVAIDLARRGHRLHGVDVEERMLAVLAERTLRGEAELGGRLTFERADVRTMNLGRRFPLVTAPFNGIAHQHGADALGAFLAGVRRHLERDGVFAFDTWVLDDAQRRGRVSDSPRFRDPRDGSPVRCTETLRWDAPSRTMNIAFDLHHLDRDEPETLTLSLRVIDPDEMRPILDAAGLRVVESVDLGEMRGWVCRA